MVGDASAMRCISAEERWGLDEATSEEWGEITGRVLPLYLGKNIGLAYSAPLKARRGEGICVRRVGCPTALPICPLTDSTVSF